MSFPVGLTNFVNDCKETFNETILPCAKLGGRVFIGMMHPRAQEENENKMLYMVKEGAVFTAKLTVLFAITFAIVSLVKPLFITASLLALATGVFIACRNDQISAANKGRRPNPESNFLVKHLNMYPQVVIRQFDAYMRTNGY